MRRKALITGVAGQTGSYMAELLIGKDYDVYGLVRRTSSPNLWRLEDAMKWKAFEIVEGDLTDQGSLMQLVQKIKPDEVYNLAAQSHVHRSWSEPVMTADITGVGAARMLEAIRLMHPQARFYQASSSEMFGKVRETPQSETTPFYPRSPYGCAKAYAHYMTVNYRESYKLFACCGIAFNHESKKRSEEFVTRKVTRGVAHIKAGIDHELRLGSLDPKRDWGHARDYCRAMWMMLQNDKPDDFVIATGEAHSVREFVQIAFAQVGLEWEDYVVEDPAFIRPAEVDLLVGQTKKIRDELGWSPKVSFRELVAEMVDADCRRVSPQG